MLWLAPIGLLAFGSSATRPSALGVLRALLNWKLVVSFLSLAAYMTAVLAVMSAMSIWDSSLLKDTIVWFVFSGVVMCFNALERAHEADFWRASVIEQLRVLLFVEWLLNAYTFSLGGELLLVPVLAILAFAQGLGPARAETRKGGELAGTLLGVITLGLLGFALGRAYREFSPGAAADAFVAVVIPMLLTVCLLPGAWVLGLVGVYERLAIRMGSRIGDPKGRRPALRIMCFNRFRPSRIQNFTKRYGIELLAARSDESLSEVFRMARFGEPGEAEKP